MCGICGIALAPNSGRRLDPALVERMRDTIAHRGPDGVGLHVDGPVGLGHRRLSIVDVAHGAQPMASDDGRLQIVFNGEVFNHPAVMRELQAQGARYRTHCDTETIVRLYERVGHATPSRLRGMFAFAIWDRAERELFIARDRLGVKPLYYAHTSDGSLYFASEIKAILATGAVAPALNVRALPDYLANHAPSGDETLFEGVRRLPPGHTLRWKDGAVQIEQYWDLSFAHEGEDARSDADIVADYAERFEEAVRLRLMADVPLGAFLSGGIDSAAITAMMAKLVDGPVKTFSVAFAEREANELAYARMVAERFRTDHHEIVVTPEQFWAATPTLVWHEDEPMAHPSSVALNFVSRLASEHVKVVLTGEGSDETLAGYNRYRATIFNRQLGARYERLTTPGVRGAVRRGIDALPARSRVRQKLGRTFLSRASDLDTLYFDNFAVFSRAEQPALLTPGLRAATAGVNPYAAYHTALGRTDARTLLNQLLYADTKTYLHELLMKQDQMSMAASIESRVPFLDHHLMEFAARMPERMKLRGLDTKYVLRQAMQGVLPAEILTRKKMGFPVPVGAWLRGPYRHLLDEYVTGERASARGIFDRAYARRLVAEHAAGERNHAERLWSLINFEMWQRIFLDGEDAAAVGAAPGAAALAAAR